MKKLFLSVLASATILLSFAQQNHQFSITWSKGLAGGSKPTTTPIDKSDAVSNSQANDLVKYFLESSKLDFKCIYNGCQNRAMVMSLLLKQKGIKHYKIWNFDPFKISLFNAQDALDVDDVLKLKTNRIVWDFHVAIAILVKNTNNTNIDTLVIDPSFSDKPIKVSDWLSFQHSPNSYYTFLDPQWYNFVTLQSDTKYWCKDFNTGITDTVLLKLPKCFPMILTGDFYYYDNSNQKIIAEELATNDQISKIANEIINKLPSTDPSRQQLISIISDNFIAFQNILKGMTPVNEVNPFYNYVNEYKAAYANSVDYWTKQLQALN